MLAQPRSSAPPCSPKPIHKGRPCLVPHSLADPVEGKGRVRALLGHMPFDVTQRRRSKFFFFFLEELPVQEQRITAGVGKKISLSQDWILWVLCWSGLLQDWIIVWRAGNVSYNSTYTEYPAVTGGQM